MSLIQFFAALVLSASVSAQAAEVTGVFVAPFDQVNGKQINALAISIEDDDSYGLVIDPNACDFQEFGLPRCTEIAPVMSRGNLVLETRQNGLALYSLSGSPGLQIVILGSNNNSVVRFLQRNDANHVITSRELRRSN